MMMMVMCMGIMAAISSCLGDTDDTTNSRTLTPTQKSTQIYEMAGTYTGHAYFTNDTTMTVDSIACSWSITALDSAIIIPNFPVAILANGIKDNTARAALLNGGYATFNAVLHPYYNDSYANGLYTYWMLPKDNKMEFALYSNDTRHDVKVDLTYQMQATNGWSTSANFYAIGEYINRKMVAYILIKDVVFDNAIYTTGWAVNIYGSK